MKTIEWQDFEQVELRAGTVVRAEEFPESRQAAYRLWIDFGDDIGVLKSSAQITELYTLSELDGMQVLSVVNFPAKQIGPFMSQCLVCGFYRDDGAVVLATPNQPVPDGAKLA
ncbi:MAG: tRNA-binding protein [Gammaproteobacteria bacterium]|nr:tRNA-binding protein [Gammaproteobacteria bacterium]